VWSKCENENWPIFLPILWRIRNGRLDCPSGNRALVYLSKNPIFKRSTKLRSTTRKALMTCIFGLSQELFGKKFTKKTKTNKAADKSKNHYNYTTDEAVLKTCIEMADWSRRPLADIKPEIVQRYNLQQRKEHDKTVCIGFGVGYLRMQELTQKTAILCKQLDLRSGLSHRKVLAQTTTQLGLDMADFDGLIPVKQIEACLEASRVINTH